MSFQFLEPRKAPLAIKWLIGIMLCIAFFSPIASYFLHRAHLYGTTELLQLSLWGITKGFFWQLATYLFIQPGGVSIFSFIALVFNLLILWAAGSLIIDEFGTPRFLILYLGSGIFAGCIGFIVMHLVSYSNALSGPSTALYAVLFTLSMLLPDLEAAFFFLVRIKIKWIIFIFIGFSLLISLFSGEWVFFASESAAIIFAYLFGVIFLRLRSPFPRTHKFDRFLHQHSFLLYSFFKKQPQSEKIVDLKEEMFMEEMLTKISKKGKQALSPSEMRRMNKISKKRKN